MSKKGATKLVQKSGAVRTKKIEMMLLKDSLGMYHSLSFAEDDKQRPGEDVTSSKCCKISFKKQKACESIWPTLQVFEIEKRDKKDTDKTHRASTAKNEVPEGLSEHRK